MENTKLNLKWRGMSASNDGYVQFEGRRRLAFLAAS